MIDVRLIVVMACSGAVIKFKSHVPEVFFQPAEVSAGVVVFAETLAPGSAAGCHGVRDRALRPRSVAQSVGDHAPRWNGDSSNQTTEMCDKTRTSRSGRAVFDG